MKVETPTSQEFAKSLGSFGLCYDNQSGFRKNWQVGRTVGPCEVNTDAEACSEEDLNCGGFNSPPRFGGGTSESWGSCGNGARSSCNELYCSDGEPSAAQQCSLKQADRISCELKYGAVTEGVADNGCPEDPCVWKLDVVSRGCPQEDPPFSC